MALTKNLVKKEGLRKNKPNIKVEKAKISGFGISRDVSSFAKEDEFDIE